MLNALPIKNGQNWLLMAQVPYLLIPAAEEPVSLTMYAKEPAADKDPVIVAAGKLL